VTGCFGKWHNGTQYPYHPRGRGFDEYYGFTSGHWGDYFSPPLDHNGEIVQGKGFIVDDLTEHAMAFMEQSKAAEKPFFCYLPIPTPHTPAQVPDEFFAKFAGADLKLRGGKAESLDKTRAVLAMCENIDWNVGRVLAKLDELKLGQDTIVVYFQDNGPNGVRWNGGMRGIKGSTDEGGVRSPLMIRWPGKIGAGLRVSQIAGAIDLLPTLADLAGVEVKGKPLDGVSLKPLLMNSGAAWAERMIFAHWGGRVSARSQGHRLDAMGRLYDIVADPGQTTDITKKTPDEAAKLSGAVEKWKREVLSELKGGQGDDRPLVVGHTEFPMTQFPARDGVGHGNIRRSAQAPNSSFFTNWIGGKDDRMTWDVEVATAGKYEAAVYYTCAAGDVGLTIELGLNGTTVRAKVIQPNDPPLRGMEHDRVKRDLESYVKDFKPLTIGMLDLKAGRGALTLRAVEVAGKAVMDVRLVTLRLVK